MIAAATGRMQEHKGLHYTSSRSELAGPCPNLDLSLSLSSIPYDGEPYPRSSASSIPREPPSPDKIPYVPFNVSGNRKEKEQHTAAMLHTPPVPELPSGWGGWRVQTNPWLPVANGGKPVFQPVEMNDDDVAFSIPALLGQIPLRSSKNLSSLSPTQSACNPCLPMKDITFPGNHDRFMDNCAAGAGTYRKNSHFNVGGPNPIGDGRARVPSEPTVYPGQTYPNHRSGTWKKDRELSMASSVDTTYQDRNHVGPVHTFGSECPAMAAAGAGTLYEAQKGQHYMQRGSESEHRHSSAAEAQVQKDRLKRAVINAVDAACNGKKQRCLSHNGLNASSTDSPHAAKARGREAQAFNSLRRGAVQSPEKVDAHSSKRGAPPDDSALAADGLVLSRSASSSAILDLELKLLQVQMLPLASGGLSSNAEMEPRTPGEKKSGIGGAEPLSEGEADAGSESVDIEEGPMGEEGRGSAEWVESALADVRRYYEEKLAALENSQEEVCLKFHAAVSAVPPMPAFVTAKVFPWPSLSKEEIAGRLAYLRHIYEAPRRRLLESFRRDCTSVLLSHSSSQSRDVAGKRRLNLPKHAVTAMKAWLFNNFLLPYPGEKDKRALASRTGLTVSQVNNWFINARVRLWRPLVEELCLEQQREDRILQQQTQGGKGPKSMRLPPVRPHLLHSNLLTFPHTDNNGNGSSLHRNVQKQQQEEEEPDTPSPVFGNTPSQAAESPQGSAKSEREVSECGSQPKPQLFLCLAA